MWGGLQSVAFFFLCSSFARSTQAQGVMDRSFEQRLQMYSDWAGQIQTKGRSLANAYSPEKAPAPERSDGKFPMKGYGYCKVLRYQTGFANTTLYYDKFIKDSPNFGECCKSCGDDPRCKAWTRVAGGDAPNFRNCYLKYRLLPRDPQQIPEGFDLSPNKFDNNHVGRPDDDKKYPELRYVNVGYANPQYPVILESGTIDDVYPPEYYGCPYEPYATTPCRAPPTCNFDGNNKFVDPPCL